MMSNQKPKLIIAGHARHGKDTVCEMMNMIGSYTYQSSSEAALHEFLYDKLKIKYGYKTPEECFEDRVNHRQEWYDEICDYGKDDLTKIGRLIFSKADIYCGIRNQDELVELRRQRLYDYFIWVDASRRLPPEPSESMTICSKPDLIIHNNCTLNELKFKVFELVTFLLGEYRG